jgi:pimeloyl-ACP methyl ester carboxylesterase
MISVRKLVWTELLTANSPKLFAHTQLKMKSLRLTTSGLRVAYQVWGEGNPIKVLCLHGWLDNSNSFNVLAPFLSQHGGFEVVAIDHIGHGFSDHLPQQNVFVRYVGQVKGVLDALGWKKTHIVGHSMGTAIGTLVAGCYPEMVDRLVLIEGLGPMTAPADGTAARIRKSIEAEEMAAAKAAKGGNKRLYPTIASAIDSRMNIVKTYPGMQTLSYEGAYAIVSRSIGMATTAVSTGDSAAAAGTAENPLYTQTLSQELVDMSNLNAGPVFFRYDPKLMLPTMVYLTEDQVLSIIGDIKSPTLAIKGGNAIWLVKDFQLL